MNSTSTYYDYNAGGNFHYLSIPIQANIKLIPKWSVVPYIEAGPRFDVLVGRRINDDTPPMLEERLHKFDRTNLGANTGIGFSIPDLSDKVSIDIGAAINWDLTPSSYENGKVKMYDQSAEGYVKIMF